MSNLKTPQAFWEERYQESIQKGKQLHVDEAKNWIVRPYLSHIKGKKILDLGCGKGDLSVLLASHGAMVTAIDMSESAVNLTKKLAEEYQDIIVGEGGSVNALCMDALALDKFPDGTFDFVFGSMVLHHIEPFSLFAKKMAATVKHGGKLVFYENSSRNKLLMFVRTHLVGHFGIPRMGDGIEIPLTDMEIDELKKYFKVNVTIPKLVLFQLLGEYIFRNKKAIVFLGHLDSFCYKQFPFMRRWSYHQLLVMKKF